MRGGRGSGRGSGSRRRATRDPAGVNGWATWVRREVEEGAAIVFRLHAVAEGVQAGADVLISSGVRVDETFVALLIEGQEGEQWHQLFDRDPVKAGGVTTHGAHEREH